MKFSKLFVSILVAACAALLATSARADITWNWSAGAGAHQGTFTTLGSNVAPLSAGNYTITDAAFTVSPFMPLGSVSSGTYVTGGRLTVPPYFIVWDGSAVTNIDATANSGVNGLVITTPSNAEAIFGADNFGNDGGNRWFFENGDRTISAAGTDLTTVPVLVPEPASLSLLVLGGLALLRRRRASDVLC